MHLIRSETTAIGIGYYYSEFGVCCWEIYLGPWALLFCKEEDLP